MLQKTHKTVAKKPQFHFQSIFKENRETAIFFNYLAKELIFQRLFVKLILHRLSTTYGTPFALYLY